MNAQAQNMQIQAAATPAATRNPALVPAVTAIALGLFFLFGTAFAQVEVMHNGAHDSRHSFSFPCH